MLLKHVYMGEKFQRTKGGWEERDETKVERSYPYIFHDGGSYHIDNGYLYDNGLRHERVKETMSLLSQLPTIPN